MTPPQLVRYRACRRIEPQRVFDEDMGRMVLRCRNDGLWIYPIRGGMRHDTGQVRMLAQMERGEIAVGAV
jgi:hypothetical protein